MLKQFLIESLAIEGIHREPTDEEIAATERFLNLPRITLDDVCALQEVYAPGMPLRSRRGMNVRVGDYVAPYGGRAIPVELEYLCAAISSLEISPYNAHFRFEVLHPFLDGNGRTGRALWLWHMLRIGHDPYALSFLHWWYYASLSAAR